MYNILRLLPKVNSRMNNDFTAHICLGDLWAKALYFIGCLFSSAKFIGTQHYSIQASTSKASLAIEK